MIWKQEQTKEINQTSFDNKMKTNYSFFFTHSSSIHQNKKMIKMMMMTKLYIEMKCVCVCVWKFGKSRWKKKPKMTTESMFQCWIWSYIDQIENNNRKKMPNTHTHRKICIMYIFFLLGILYVNQEFYLKKRTHTQWNWRND